MKACCKQLPLEFVQGFNRASSLHDHILRDRKVVIVGTNCNTRQSARSKHSQTSIFNT